MKQNSHYRYSVPATLLVVMFLVTAVCTSMAGAVSFDAALVFSAVPQTDPSTQLSRGRTLLKQGHADQALPLLEPALTGFTSTNNPRGIAAAEDALGDLYMIQGQDKIALDHYKSAYQSFVVASGKDQTSAGAASAAA